MIKMMIAIIDDDDNKNDDHDKTTLHTYTRLQLS